MLIFQNHALTLPLNNPVLIFALILFIILFAPILLNKVKIPHLIGLIIAGAVIGPNGLNLIQRDSSIILFGTVGLLYIMFLAGIEMDIENFKKNSRKSLVFGLFTFFIPLALGFTASYFMLKFSLLSSVLLASMFSSHTLIAYPIVSKFGVVKNRAVNITVGGTMITDTLALLVLAIVSGMAAGKTDHAFWLKLGIGLTAFSLIISIGFPIIGRWFFKRFDDSVSQYIFVLAMVFLGAFLAEAAGVEAIIGAFLSGLSLNRLIPHTSPLMYRIEFTGNALFIPFFLIGVGMIVDFQAFLKDQETILVALTLVVVATSSKFFAAWLTQKTFRFSRDERRLIFGLSNAHAAATMAIVLVGYNLILNQAEVDAGALQGIVVEPVRLLNESVLNGTILVILVTCTIASFVAQIGAQNISKAELTGAEQEELPMQEKILIPVSNAETIEQLVHLALTIKSHGNKHDLFALNIIGDHSLDEAEEKNARKVLETAARAAAGAEVHLQQLVRYDPNIANGITGVVRERKITDLILGLHQKKGISDKFLGYLTEGILSKSNTTTLICNPAQPLATLRRHLVVIPPFAEKEIGFPFWLLKIWNIGRNTGAKMVFYASEKTMGYLRDVQSKHPIACDFVLFPDWEALEQIPEKLRPDDNLILVMSRRERPSYTSSMADVPDFLNTYLKGKNFMLVYPMQSGVSEEAGVDYKNPSVLETLETFEEFGRIIGRLFRKK